MNYLNFHTTQACSTLQAKYWVYLEIICQKTPRHMLCNYAYIMRFFSHWSNLMWHSRAYSCLNMVCKAVAGVHWVAKFIPNTISQTELKSITVKVLIRASVVSSSTYSQTLHQIVKRRSLVYMRDDVYWDKIWGYKVKLNRMCQIYVNFCCIYTYFWLSSSKI